MTAEPDDASRGELVLYQAADGSVELRLRLEHETLWLSQRQMALLFDKDSDTIGLHLRNIYAEGELDEAATTEDSSVVQTEGRRRVRRSVRVYNLDAVLSVGYRVSSRCGTQFRIWATNVLREHLVRGYTVNRQRLRELSQAVRLIADPGRGRAMTWQRHSRGNAGHGRLVGEKVVRNQALTTFLGVGPIPSSSKGFGNGSSKDPIRRRIQ